MSGRVIRGAITSPFGRRHDPINRLWREHNGVDVAAPTGSAVYSPVAGTVHGVYAHPSGGKTLIIGSKDGALRFGFCHLSGYRVAIGDVVSRGQCVARSGNTGRTTGPHLHFTVKCGGRWHPAYIAEDGTRVEAAYIGGDFVDPEPYMTFE